MAAIPETQSLTLDQAKQIVDVSGIPSEFDYLKPTITEEIVRITTMEIPKKRQTFNELLRQAKSVCSKEAVEDNFKSMSELLNNHRENGIDEAVIKQLSIGLAYGIAILLAYGFEDVDKQHFTYDKNGNITGVNERNKTRKPRCNADLQSKSTKWRPNPFTDGGHKTRHRKQGKKKQRKTLRRTRH